MATATKKRKTTKRKTTKNIGPMREHDYDTVAKNAARKRALRFVTKRKANYLALPSAEGLDVQDILRKNPKNTVHCIEFKRKVLNKFLKKKLVPVEDTFRGQLSKFVKTDKFQDTEYRLLVLDLMGYVCGGLCDNVLKPINRLHNSEYIVLTQCKTTDKFRCPKGEFKERAEREFKGDKTKECLEFVMSNYTCTEDWEYKRQEGKFVVMRMFTFKRKKGLK